MSLETNLEQFLWQDHLVNNGVVHITGDIDEELTRFAITQIRAVESLVQKGLKAAESVEIGQPYGRLPATVPSSVSALGTALHDLWPLLRKLDKYFSEEPDEYPTGIEIWLSSSGGSPTHALSLGHIIRNLGVPTAVVGYGTVASAATVILASGPVGARYALPDTEIMMHRLLGVLAGHDDDVLRQAQQMTKVRGQMVRFLAECSGQSEARITGDIEKGDFYLTPDEAKAYGLIDRVWGVDEIEDEDAKS